MIHPVQKHSIDAHIMVVLILACTIGLCSNWHKNLPQVEKYLTMNSAIRVEVAAGEVIDMHLGELIDYSIRQDWLNTLRDEERTDG